MAKVARGKALVAKLRAQAGVRDPEALAAYLGRFKKARKAGKSVAAAAAAAKGGDSSNGSSKGTSKADAPKTRAEVKDMARRKGENARTEPTRSADDRLPTWRKNREIGIQEIRKLSDTDLEKRRKALLSRRSNSNIPITDIEDQLDELYAQMRRRSLISPQFYDKWREVYRRNVMKRKK